jgi:glutathione S-transferase
MHSGFGALRSHCPMNIEARLPQVGQLVWRDQASVRADVQRLESMWRSLLEVHGGKHFLFGDFSIADAFFAPVCMRLTTYALPVATDTAAYIERVSQAPGVAAWISDALTENDFLDFEEPYRVGR